MAQVCKQCHKCKGWFANDDFKSGVCVVCYFSTPRPEWRQVNGDTTHQRLVRGLVAAHRDMRVRGSFKKQLAAEMFLSTDARTCHTQRVQSERIEDFSKPFRVFDHEALCDLKPGTSPFPDAWLFDREDLCVHIYEVEDHADLRKERRDEYLSLFMWTMDAIPWEMMVYHIDRYGALKPVVGPCLWGSNPAHPVAGPIAEVPEEAFLAKRRAS